MINQTPNKIILFDIDNTIFNTVLYREKLFNNLATQLDFDSKIFSQIAKEEYALLRKKAHYLDPDSFLNSIIARSEKATNLEELQSVFWDKKLYESCVYPDVKKTFSYLIETDIQIGIFSTGHSTHQNTKIESLKEYLSDNHIYISPNKIKIIKDTFTVYLNKKTYIIDDFPDILHEVKKHHINVFTIWIKRSNTSYNSTIPKNFKPDATITDLYQLIDIIKNQ
ncbi:MAG TPA: HAD hydrolase-like protein [Candidatus Limnocylindrales bacterium]|nr:HAD hydrolase-like protein [Candidatus Limnocylindrales bacterium]